MRRRCPWWSTWPTTLLPSGCCAWERVRAGEHSPAEHVVGQLAARRVAGVVELSALGAAQVETIAAACLRTSELPPRVGNLVTDWAEGVPFLVEEILATLVSAGALRQEPEGWIVRDTLAPVLPLSFVQSVQPAWTRSARMAEASCTRAHCSDATSTGNCCRR